MQFTDDEIETIKSIICDWGSGFLDTDSDKVKELEYKLGLSVRPTPEEIAERERRYEEIRNSSYAKMIAELMSHTNNYLTKSIFSHILKPSPFDETNFKIGTNLRIKLPNDYAIKKD
jgi:hypothetical protein